MAEERCGEEQYRRFKQEMDAWYKRHNEVADQGAHALRFGAQATAEGVGDAHDPNVILDAMWAAYVLVRDGIVLQVGEGIRDIQKDRRQRQEYGECFKEFQERYYADRGIDHSLMGQLRTLWNRLWY